MVRLFLCRKTGAFETGVGDGAGEREREREGKGEVLIYLLLYCCIIFDVDRTLASGRC